MNERFYLLNIQLLDIEPAIWRRFVVPVRITLDRLHDVIQIVMGCTDRHLHECTIGNKRYTEYPESKEDGLVCLEGERACPTEDVGGATGYFEFLSALKDPSHEKHESYMEWSGGDFDSEQFDSEPVNRELTKYLRWSRDSYQNWGGVE